MEIQPRSLGSSRPWGEPGPCASLQLRGGNGECFPCDLVSLGDVLSGCRRGGVPSPCPDEGSHIPRALLLRRDGLVGARSPHAEAAPELTRAFVLSPAATSHR